MFWLNIFLSLREAKRRSNLKAYKAISYIPKKRYIWTQIRILHRADKAILVDNGMKIWIPKSWMHGIRLRNNIFEIHVKESTVG